MKEQNTGEYDALVDEVEKLRAEIAKLLAEREAVLTRLKALEEIATAVEADIDCGRPLEYNVEHLRDELIRTRAAILADEPKEERGEEGPCCKCVEEKGAPPCEFCGPPAWEAFQERESSWEPMVRALIGLLPRRERRWLKGVVDAEVERRIEEVASKPALEIYGVMVDELEARPDWPKELR